MFNKYYVHFLSVLLFCSGLAAEVQRRDVRQALDMVEDTILQPVYNEIVNGQGVTDQTINSYQNGFASLLSKVADDSFNIYDTASVYGIGKVLNNHGLVSIRFEKVHAMLEKNQIACKSLADVWQFFNMLIKRSSQPINLDYVEVNDALIHAHESLKEDGDLRTQYAQLLSKELERHRFYERHSWLIQKTVGFAITVAVMGGVYLLARTPVCKKMLCKLPKWFKETNFGRFITE